MTSIMDIEFRVQGNWIGQEKQVNLEQQSSRKWIGPKKSGQVQQSQTDNQDLSMTIIYDVHLI